MMLSQVDNIIKEMSDLQDHCTSCLQNIDKTSDIRHKFKAMRSRGYVFYVYSNGQEYEKIYCGVCGKKINHRRLVHVLPQEPENFRSNFSPKIKLRSKEIYKYIDAFDSIVPAYSKERIQVDHRIPELLKQKQGISHILSVMSDEEIRKTMMLLTPSNNELKSRKCEKCIETGVRPSSRDGVKYWYCGDEKFDVVVGCNGCFWAYPEKWREQLNIRLKIGDK
jgi:hypothetical protein